MTTSPCVEDGRAIKFNTSEHRHFDHDYAVTSHSSQGLTAARVLIHGRYERPSEPPQLRFGYVSISRSRNLTQSAVRPAESTVARGSCLVLPDYCKYRLRNWSTSWLSHLRWAPCYSGTSEDSEELELDCSRSYVLRASMRRETNSQAGIY